MAWRPNTSQTHTSQTHTSADRDRDRGGMPSRGGYRWLMLCPFPHSPVAPHDRFEEPVLRCHPPSRSSSCTAPLASPLRSANSLSRSHPYELTARLCGPSRRAVSASPGRRIPRPRPHCTRASMPRARRVGRWAHQRHGDG